MDAPLAFPGVATTIERFPLFPLGIVLLPQEVVPLHIFEERYKLMIGDCLDDERDFGILWLADGGLREIGCSARIDRVVERFDDGRMVILIQGASPFRLRSASASISPPDGNSVSLSPVRIGQNNVVSNPSKPTECTAGDPFPTPP